MEFVYTEAASCSLFTKEIAKYKISTVIGYAGMNERSMNKDPLIL